MEEGRAAVPLRKTAIVAIKDAKGSIYVTKESTA